MGNIGKRKTRHIKKGLLGQEPFEADRDVYCKRDDSKWRAANWKENPMIRSDVYPLHWSSQVGQNRSATHLDGPSRVRDRKKKKREKTTLSVTRLADPSDRYNRRRLILFGQWTSVDQLKKRRQVSDQRPLMAVQNDCHGVELTHPTDAAVKRWTFLIQIFWTCGHAKTISDFLFTQKNPKNPKKI